MVIARECDVRGERRIGTSFPSLFAEKIGVLTKADTVQPGEYEPWIKILRNLEHKIRYGYYMTRQLTTDQVKRGMTWEEGRTQEREYFVSKNHPWFSRSFRCLVLH